jgi:NAD(P)H dehydrogenase (quinone)
MAVMSILNALLNYGYMVFGLPEYSAPGVTAHYGAVAVQKPGSAELESCRMLGKRTAEYVKRMFG